MERVDDWGSLRAIGYAQELTNLARGTDKAILPAAWSQSQQIPFRAIAIFALSTPANSHSFKFTLQQAGTNLGSVVMTTSGNYWKVDVNFSMKGYTDWITVEHNAAGVSSEMSDPHTEEGNRIWAILIPS